MTYVHPTRGPLHLGRPRRSPYTAKSVMKAFRLHDFLVTLPTPPDTFDGSSGILDWGMMDNDRLGDCTCAACGHMIQAWTAMGGTEITVPDSAILTEYMQACGYNPADPSTDQGGIIANVLDYFRDTGVGGHKILAHAEVNLTQLRVEQAMYVFDALDLGISLPITAQAQVGNVWDLAPNAQTNPDAQPGSWGGHSVAAVYYSPAGVDCVTWGAIQRMTWQFFMYYVEEAHACISPDWTASPVPVDQLVSDLQQITA